MNARPDPSPPELAPAGVAADVSRLRRPAVRAKSEQRVRDILREARQVFAARGYEHATTTEIAQRLGISEATVFTYFRGKRELCTRVIVDWYDEIVAEIEAGLPQQGPVRLQVEFIVRTHLRLFLQQGTGLCALVLSEGRSRGQDFADVLAPLQRRYTAPLMDVLARGQASGEIRTDLPLRLLRSLVYGPMEHILWETIGSERQLDIDGAADAVIALLWPALCAPQAELGALRTLRAEVQAALARSAQA